MKRFLAILVLALSGCPAWATFALQQHVPSGSATNCSSGVSSCSITVTVIRPGDLLIVDVLGAGSWSISSVTDNGTPASTYVHCPSCQVSATPGDVDMSYCLSAANNGGGSISVTVTLTSAPTNTWWVRFWEFSYTGSSVAFDAAGTRSQTSNATSTAGVGLTLTGTNDVIVQSVKTGGGNVTAISGGAGYTISYTNNLIDDAYALNISDGTAPTWTMGSSKSVLNAIAFKEVSAAACANRIALMGAGCN